jgi:predicted RNA-binding protein with PUA-like domain
MATPRLGGNQRTQPAIHNEDAVAFFSSLPASPEFCSQSNSTGASLTSMSSRRYKNMSTWIFQGNPKLFRMDEYLSARRHRQIVWAIRQKHFIKSIAVGDEVYIWRANGRNPGTGGIVAKGTISSTPKNMLDDAPELWMKPQVPLWESRVEILMDEVRLTKEQGMIRRVSLQNDPCVCAMRILRFYSETNYKLDTPHAEHVRELWDKRRR